MGVVEISHCISSRATRRVKCLAGPDCGLVVGAPVRIRSMLFQILFGIVVVYVLCRLFRAESKQSGSYPKSIDRLHALLPASIHDRVDRLGYSANMLTQQAPLVVYSRDVANTLLDLKNLNRIDADVILLQRVKCPNLLDKKSANLCRVVSSVEASSDYTWLVAHDPTSSDTVQCAIGIQARRPIIVEKYSCHVLPGGNCTLSVLTSVQDKPIVFSSSMVTNNWKTLSNVSPLSAASEFTGHVLGVHFDSTMSDSEVESLNESFSSSEFIYSNSKMDLVVVNVPHRFDQMGDFISSASMGTHVKIYTSLSGYTGDNNTDEYRVNLMDSLSRAVYVN